MRIFSWTVLAFFSLSAGGHAATLDFTSGAYIDTTVSAYVEDGFAVDGSATTYGEINPFFGAGALIEANLGIGEYFSITSLDGGDFTLQSLDYAAADGGLLSDGFRLAGYADGAIVADYGSYSASSSTLATLSFLGGEIIDELRIVGTGLQALALLSTSVYFDNIVVETVGAAVPLPASLPLLLAGLGGLWAVRRRRSLTGA